jgi:hypothetical protein
VGAGGGGGCYGGGGGSDAATSTTFTATGADVDAGMGGDPGMEGNVAAGESRGCEADNGSEVRDVEGADAAGDGTDGDDGIGARRVEGASGEQPGRRRQERGGERGRVRKAAKRSRRQSAEGD